MAPPEAESTPPEDASPDASPKDPNPLLSLARRCVVRIEETGGRFLGSGFFVLPGVVVTCGHVVHGALGVRVVWEEAEPVEVERVVTVPAREEVRRAAEYPLPDLALLHVAADAALASRPCARMVVDTPAGGVDPDRFYAAGYTREHVTSVPALNGAMVRFESFYTERQHQLWKLQEGEVPRGLSGGLLLSLRTGDVVGVVESSRDPAAPRGGFAVPVAEVDAAFPELLSANRGLHDDGELAGVWARAVEDEATRTAERAGQRERLPLVDPVGDLEWQPGDSTTELLRPVYHIVPYVGRERLRRAMTDWCEARGDEPVGIWFVTGGGGFGKTRLAIELCGAAGLRGWTTGLLDPAVTGVDSRLAELAGWPGRLLVAIDYAEARPAAVKELVKQLRRRRSPAPVRIVALVRRRMTRAELVDHFDVSEGTVELGEPGERRLIEVPEALRVLETELNEAPRDVGFRTLLTRAVLSRLDETTEDVDRLELFRVAHDEFARRHGRPPPDAAQRPPALRAEHFERPLYVLAAALLVAAGDSVDVDSLSESELLLQVLRDHEADHWTRTFERGVRRGDWALPLHPHDRWTGVALATLLGAGDGKEARAVARLVPGLGTEDQITGVARWLATLYPDWSSHSTDNRVHPLEPDRLGEVLVADVLGAYPGLLERAADKASPTQQVRLFSVAARVAVDRPDVRTQLHDLLDRRFPDLLAGALAHEGRDLFTAVMAAFAVAKPWRGALIAADMFPQRLSTSFASLAAYVTSVAAEGLRQTQPSQSHDRSELARILTNLANWLSETGQHHEALTVAQQAADIFGDLAATDPVAHLDKRAMSLHNLARSLWGVGRRQDALTVAQEAVDIYREIAVTNPAAHLPDLAQLLTIFAAFQAELGRHQDALSVAQEAVGIYREIALTDRAVHLPDLAGSLNNLATVLTQMDRNDEALSVAQQATDIYRELAAVSPAMHLHKLAMAVHNLAKSLSRAGRPSEALTVAQEAVDLQRDLAASNPSAHLPDLAGSLIGLAICLSRVGRPGEALTVAQEAVDIRRDLAASNPSAYLPDLASSLTNLASRLSDAGRTTDALTIDLAAVDIRRDLAASNRSAHLSDLASSLTNLASRLSDAGRTTDALTVDQEAVDIYRDLAASNPSAHLPDLASSLTSLTISLSDAGRNDEALSVAEEADRCYRNLAAVNPNAHLSNLAKSLHNLAALLSKTGRHSEAFDIAQQAVDTYRDLAEADPSAHLPALARSLHNLSALLSEAGRHSEAIEIAQQGLDTYRVLAIANPRAHLPEFITSLKGFAYRLLDAGRSDDVVEVLFDRMLIDIDHNPVAGGLVLLGRGEWRHRTGRSDACIDMQAALDVFHAAGELIYRGRARTALREQRASDPAGFDNVWGATREGLPVWLAHPEPDPTLRDLLIGWIQEPEQTGSQAYLATHERLLLTDEAEANLEHLIDANPSLEELGRRLELLRLARVQGIGHAYEVDTARRARLYQLSLLQEWMSSPTWAVSARFAVAHHDALVVGATRALLHRGVAQAPADHTIRLHAGLIELLAAEPGEAYKLVLDPDARNAALAEAEAAGNDARALALARVASAQEPDNPEAHYWLVIAAVQNDLPNEAGIAAAECRDHAAPYESADFGRRLRAYAEEHTEIASIATTLIDTLTTTTSLRTQQEATHISNQPGYLKTVE